MTKLSRSFRTVLQACACSIVISTVAQNAEPPPPPDGLRPPPGQGPPRGDGPGFNGPPQFGPPGGMGRGGFGGVREKMKLVQQFDKDGDHRLNSAERKAAFEYLQKEGIGRRGMGGRGGFRGRGENQEPAQPGKKMTPADVKSFPKAPLFDPRTLRTYFLEFEDADWEKQLAAFKNTDVEVAAKLTVDGKTYSDVGVHFRGMSSFGMVGEGRKRSLNLSFDFVHKDQHIGGYRTIELLNSHEDASFLRTVLSYQIEREYVPAPKANFARVVINGENWGIYVNKEQYNKDFVKEWFSTTKGARWKVPGSPGGRGSLAYIGDDAAAYKRIYQIKSKDDSKAWSDLIRLCKVLNETSPENLEAALAPLLDIDGALKFLALENVLINNDGYWIRTSDYSIYEDTKGRFHIIPQDSNETFSMPGGPGFGGGRGGPGGFGGRRGFAGPNDAGGPPNGPGGPPRFDGPPGAPRGFGGPGNEPGEPGGRRGPGGPGMPGGMRPRGVELDPLFAANDPNKPLLSKLLAVPSLKKRYLGYVHDIAEKWLDWNKLGPVAQQYHSLIADDVKIDTRKLESTEGFLGSLTGDSQGGGFPGGGSISLKKFAETRRAYLLGYSEKPAASN